MNTGNREFIEQLINKGLKEQKIYNVLNRYNKVITHREIKIIIENYKDYTERMC
jgi:hypothetical protein